LETPNLITEFNRRLLRNIDPNFHNRKERNEFVSKYLLDNCKTILNIGGGGKRHLESSLNNGHIKVFEIDITGDCDFKVDLDKVNKLDFNNESFDVCCAFDVLEHLEQFHLILDEMIRIAKNEVLISLPISSAEIYSVIKNKKNNTDRLRRERGVYSKFYGLPLSKPKDRHRWWLYFDDIIEYFLVLEYTNKCKVEFIVPHPKKLKAKIIRILSPRLYYNFFCRDVFIKINEIHNS
jgi:ubiquinone/menaquinone biosynthesis C-methylase UbiE